jgi:hypothetical protein
VSFDAGTVTAELHLDRKPFISSLAEARREAARFASRSYTATLGAKNNARAEIAEARREVESLDGETAEVKIDVDFNRIRKSIRQIGSLEGEMTKLASSIRAVGTIARAAAIPVLIASIGALPAVISAVVVQAGRLTLAVGQGLAGAAGVGGTAILGLAAGLKVYSAAVSSTISASRDAFDVLHENHAEQLELARAQILTTRASESFNRQLDGTILALSGVQAAIGRRVLPTFTRWLNLFESRIPALTPPLFRLVEGVTAVADSFVKALASGERFDRLQRVFGFIASSGIRAAQVAKNLGLALLAAIQPMLPLASGLQKTFVDLSRSIRQWAESAQGQRQISQFFREAWAGANQLWRIVKNLGTGFRNLFSIIAPGTGQMMANLERLSRGFAQLGAKGTESRRKIEEFVRNSQPILKALGNLVGTITREFFKLAGGVAKAQEGKKHISTLAGAINGLARAIPPVRRALQNMFKEIGPAIGPLVRQIGRFGSELAKAGGVARRTLQIMTGLLRQFNRLPGPVKNTIAQLVALRIVSRLLGFSILVKLALSLGKVTKALIGMRGGAKVAQVATTAVKGSLLRLAATILTRFGPGGAVYVFGKLAKHVLENSKTMENAIEGFADRLKNTGAFGLIKFFQNLPNALKQAIARGAENIPIFGPIIKQAAQDGMDVAKSWSKDGHKAGTNARTGFAQGLKGPNGIKDIPERTKADDRAHFGIRSPSTVFAAIGRELPAGLAQGIRNGFAPVKAAMEWLAKNTPDMVKKLLGISSPSKVMMKVGQDTAEGFARGIESKHDRIAKALSDGIGDTLRDGVPKLVKRFNLAVQNRDPDARADTFANLTENATATQRKKLEAATAATSPGGKQITREEMRQIMREAHAAQGKNIYAAAVAAGLDPRALRLLWDALDKSMGRDFNFRNNMGAAPN